MLDGKTGKPLVPDNYIVRLDHLNAMHNEALQINDDGSGKVTVPASASFLSVQGTYHGSMEIYVNCDAGMEKDTSTLHWYPIADILNSGVAMPNECYKGKYARRNARHRQARTVHLLRARNQLARIVKMNPLPPESPSAATFNSIAQVHQAYASLMQCAAPRAAQRLQPRRHVCSMPANSMTQARILIAAGNIAGAAIARRLGPTCGAPPGQRDGVIDFLVNSLDEALRILKNEIRKRQPVAVAVSVAPE